MKNLNEKINQKRISNKSIILLFSFCFVTFLICAWLYSTIPSPKVFDKLITTDLIEYGCTNIVPYTITCTDNIYELEYRINFELDTTEPDIFALIIIKIRPAWFITPSFGMFISPYGGGDMTSVTTSDHKYDIIVEQNNHGMEGVVSPVISSKKIAQEFNRLYSQRED